MSVDTAKIRERITRLRHMYETVGPNHGDIKILIEEEIPALLDDYKQRGGEQS